jgi:trans-aconitate 2-methyltransferase
MPWNPGQYLNFASERLRPALDLLAQVPLEAPSTIVDLGCGPGHITRILKDRWPSARVIGMDHSPEMLRKAALEGAGIEWQLADLAEWHVDQRVDLIYANASLHWLDDHEALFSRLMSYLRPGGCLAVQMPRNHHRPAHMATYEVAEEGPWRDRLRPLLRRQPVSEPEAYLRWLTPLASKIDLWQTDYLHLLEGPDPVVGWTRGTLLVPLMEALAEEEKGPFLEAYARKVRSAFPVDEAGRTHFWFRRLFILARSGTGA